MAYSFTSAKTYTLAGVTYASGTVELTGPGIESVSQDLAVAWPGSLTTRTDNNTGTITMTDAGHLILTGSRVDIYWTNTDGTFGCQRAVTVGTVVTTSVPFDLGIGDNLPTQGSAVIVAISQQFTFSFTGNNVKALAIGCDGRATVVLASGTVTEELAKVFTTASAYGWTSSDSETNPISGDTITFVYMSQASTTATKNVRVGVLKIA